MIFSAIVIPMHGSPSSWTVHVYQKAPFEAIGQPVVTLAYLDRIVARMIDFGTLAVPLGGLPVAEEAVSPFHELIEDIRRLRDYRDPAPLFGDLDGDLLGGEYHFTINEKTLNFMSRLIENACFVDPGHCSLYSVFRRLSLLEPHLDHYRKLSVAARHVIIIGVPDIEVDPWADNWITINISRDIHMTLLAEELPSNSVDRQYCGFHTDSRALTRRVVHRLVELKIIGQPTLFVEEQLELNTPPAD
jgi:hypothetical protein